MEQSRGPATGATDLPSSRTLLVGALNVHSANDETKQRQIQNLIVNRKLDLLLMTETWLSAKANVRDIKPPGYRMIHQPRPEGRGGGVAIVYRSDLDVSEVKELEFATESLESLVVTLETKRGPLNIAVVYRPGSASEYGTGEPEFREELARYLDKLLLLDGELLLCGDMNCYAKDVIPVSVTRLLKRLLSSRQLVQLVDKPTHVDGNLLDVLITENESTLLTTKPTVIDNIEVRTDHYLILTELSVVPEAASLLCGQFNQFLESCSLDNAIGPTEFYIVTALPSVRMSIMSHCDCINKMLIINKYQQNNEFICN